MKNEYNIFLRIARWIRRFRHRCGYGVHSPFAFDFITGVVYCSDAYYAYESLRRPLEPSISRLDEYDPTSGLTAKDLRLLFRIANWAEPSSILLHGASPIVEAYISAARRSLTPRPLPVEGSFCDENEGSVLVYCDNPSELRGICDEREAPSVSSAAPSPCERAEGEATERVALTIIIRGIHRSPENRVCWERLKASPLCTVSFDLGRFGIIIRRPKINAQHYVVNYF